MPSEFQTLLENVRPQARVPRGFGFWSDTMQLIWLRQNQQRAQKQRRNSGPLSTICPDCGGNCNVILTGLEDALRLTHKGVDRG